MPKTTIVSRLTSAEGPELSVVVPVFNEEQNAPLIAARLTAVLEACVFIP